MLRSLFGGRANTTPNYIILGFLCFFSVAPIVILLFNSLKSNLELGKNSISFPREIVLQNYPAAWEQGNFSVTMMNSVILVTGTVLGVLILGGLAAYALARLKPRGGGAYMIYMLSLSTIPFWLYAVPLFMTWRALGLINSRAGLIIIYIALNSPFAIFLLRSFLVKVSARHRGCLTCGWRQRNAGIGPSGYAHHVAGAADRRPSRGVGGLGRIPNRINFHDAR